MTTMATLLTIERPLHLASKPISSTATALFEVTKIKLFLTTTAVLCDDCAKSKDYFSGQLQAFADKSNLTVTDKATHDWKSGKHSVIASVISGGLSHRSRAIKHHSGFLATALSLT